MEFFVTQNIHDSNIASFPSFRLVGGLDISSAVTSEKWSDGDGPMTHTYQKKLNMDFFGYILKNFI